MELVLTVIGLVGLLIFVVFGILWLLAPKTRANSWSIAVVGLLVWAIATIIGTLVALL